MKTCSLILLTLTAIVQPVQLMADPQQQTIVGRSTNDRSADLVDALIRVGRTGESLNFCNDQFDRVDPASDQGAKWAIRKSQVLTARQLASAGFGKSQISAAQQPLIELLQAYPDHRRSLFLQAQKIRVRIAAAKHQVVRATVSTSDTSKDNAVETLVQLTTDAGDLIKACAGARATIDRQDNTMVGYGADLHRLQQELSVEVVSLGLMQTELFPPGSKDHIAAATKAEQAAMDAIKRIPADSPARAEMVRLKIAAILSAGQVRRAAAEFESFAEALDQTVTAPWQALQVRIQLAQDSQSQAAALLADYFRAAPEMAPRSIEMDLARLEYLLAYQKSEIAEWFDAIETRGGDYARRRAESIALTRVGRSEVDGEMEPSLLAAQGRARLRKGDLARAGEILSAAASSDDNADRALRHAAEAAAAFASAGQPERAAETLLATSLAHQQAPGAAAAHLQAIMLMRRNAPADVEALLTRQLETWPADATANHARRWLGKLLSDQARYTDAAIALSQLPPEQLNEQRFASIVYAWRAAFHQSDDDSLSRPSEQFRAAMRPLLANPIAQRQYVTIAALLLNRDSLAGLPNKSQQDPFIDSFTQFRQHGRVTEPLRSVPAEYGRDARWRLMRDGRMLPQLRPSIAQLLQTWDQGLEPTFDKAELLLWSGEAASAINMLNDLIRASGRDVDALRQTAILLATSKDRKAIERAVDIWDQIAAGTTKGNSLWHEAKLSAIRLLKANGQYDDATRRAKYVLLTMPKIDQQQRRQYEAVIP